MSPKASFFVTFGVDTQELCVNVGQREKALENRKKPEAMYQEMGMDYWLVRTKKFL
jgi:hypothetical protein